MRDDTATPAHHRVNLRLTDEELARFEAVRAIMQSRVSSNVRVTQKAAFLEGLTMLERHYNRLERDRQRER